MKPRIEVVAIDCLMLRLFDEIAESNMPWILAASERIRTSRAAAQSPASAATMLRTCSCPVASRKVGARP